ncbi:glycosyltransferase [Achromobacter sp. UMC71]|uniref:glycosyltransferase n=1 Tax=Achromobacter sp. UMC71 TaxID=1862320 RepID=UPI00160323AC|nr:glycosyltransferase [Achromobacter sp. UMC71]MBB1624647.1 glycosyltransferase [Achromobacter sp. UMC71]
MTARIAHLTTAHPRFDVRIFHKECRSLARQGYQVDLYVADGGGDTRRDDVSIIDVGPSTGRVSRMLGKTWAVWNRVRKTDARIIHIHDPELLPVALALKCTGRAVIYDAHEDLPRQILSKPWIKPWIRQAIAWPVERVENFIARRCTVVVCATPHIAQRYAAQGANSIAVNNYPIPGELGDSAEPDRPATPARGDRTICYIGGIARIRGAVEMIQALEHTDARLILAGPMESEALHASLRAMPGWSKVDYRGVLDRPGIRQVLAESQLGLVLLHPIPNYLDALPVKMFEYMAAGVPVLASDFPLWRQILDSSGTGRCADPLDATSIARSINAMLATPADELERIRAACRLAARTTYNWRNEEAKLIDAYAKIATP